TGVPKGVMLSHSALLARMYRAPADVPPPGSCMTIMKTAMSHSPFIGDIFSPLFHGCYFAIARTGGQQDVAYLGQLILKHRVSRIGMTSSLLRALLDWPRAAECRSLEAVYVGGEAVSEELRQRFHSLFPNARFVVTYGTSETGHAMAC